MGVRGGNAARNFCTVGSASILSRQRLKAMVSSFSQKNHSANFRALLNPACAQSAKHGFSAEP
jgi:hypothetical protein